MEIQVKKLCLTLLKRWWIILMAAVVFAAGGYLYTYNYVTPLYTATTTMYVENTNDYRDYISSGDLDTAARLLNTYIILFKSNSVMNKVAEEVGMGYTSQDIRAMVSATSVSATELLRISVKNPDPQRAQLIAETISKYVPAEIMRVINAGRVTVLDKAELPIVPSSPNIKQSAMQWGALGFVLACIVIAFKELLDTRIRSAEDLRQVTQIPVLGIIPSTNEKKKGKKSRAAVILTKNSPSLVNEAYRSARTNLMFMLSGKPHGRVMVTSSLPTEGKTTTCANLAISFAKANKTVLMIDCDMRSPSLHKLFGTASKPGLSDILGGFKDYSCVTKTAVNNLSLLSAGTVPPNPAELLISPAFDKLLGHFSDKYDYIFVDTPPANIFSDSMSISGEFDGVILVTKYAWTRSGRVKHMLQLFEKVNAKFIGAVINDLDHKSYIKQIGVSGGGKYYSKYGYGNSVGT